MKIDKAILLAGGSGSRLHPLTRVVCKQLLPVYDKPMIYYPLATLMLGGIREVLLVSTPADTPKFREILGDGSAFGIEIRYAVQERPEGIAHALLLGADFIGSGGVALALGDNLFFGPLDFFRRALAAPKPGATIFGNPVRDPSRYAVVELGAGGEIVSLEEKPLSPKGTCAVPGLYLYDNAVLEICRNLAPSPRGELEITDVHREYLRRGRLHVEMLGRGMTWFDTGTPESLLEASNYVAAIQHRQGAIVACLEEIGYNRGWLRAEALRERLKGFPANGYRDYLESVLAGQ